MLAAVQQNLQKLKKYNLSTYNLARKQTPFPPQFLDVQFSNKSNQFAQKYIAKISFSSQINHQSIVNDDKYKFNDYFDNLNDIYEHLLIGCYKIDLEKNQLKVFVEVETTVRVKKIITIWISTPLQNIKTDILGSLQIVRSKCMATQQQILNEGQAQGQSKNPNKFLITKLTDILIQYVKEQQKNCGNINVDVIRQKDIKSKESREMQIKEKNNYNERITNMEKKIEAINAQLIQLRREQERLSTNSQMSHSMGLMDLKDAKIDNSQQNQNNEGTKQLNKSFIDLTEHVKEVNDNMLGLIQHFSSKGYLQRKFIEIVQPEYLEHHMEEIEKSNSESKKANLMIKPKKLIKKKLKSVSVSRMYQKLQKKKPKLKYIKQSKLAFQNWIDKELSTPGTSFTNKSKIQSHGNPIRIFSTYQISGTYRFGFLIRRISIVQIGIIDREEAKKQKIFNRVENQNMFHIDNDKNCYDGTTFKKIAEGWEKKFIQKNEQVLIEVIVNLQEGIIEWALNKQILVSLKKPKLKDKNIVWLPFVRLGRECQVQLII